MIFNEVFTFKKCFKMKRKMLYSSDLKASALFYFKGKRRREFRVQIKKKRCEGFGIERKKNLFTFNDAILPNH